MGKHFLTFNIVDSLNLIYICFINLLSYKFAIKILPQNLPNSQNV